MKELRIEIVVEDDATHDVVVRWYEDLIHTDRRLYDELADTMRDLHGVERFELRRYSARLELARHLVALKVFVTSLMEALEWATEHLARWGTKVTITYLSDAYGDHGVDDVENPFNTRGTPPA